MTINYSIFLFSILEIFSLSKHFQNTEGNPSDALEENNERQKMGRKKQMKKKAIKP